MSTTPMGRFLMAVINAIRATSNEAPMRAPENAPFMMRHPSGT